MARSIANIDFSSQINCCSVYVHFSSVRSNDSVQLYAISETMLRNGRHNNKLKDTNRWKDDDDGDDNDDDDVDDDERKKERDGNKGQC